jgi:hypothetical protein
MALEPSKDQQNNENKIQKKRRGFLKKTLYAAPVIVALGALTKPTESKAAFGPPPSAPTWQ